MNWFLGFLALFLVNIVSCALSVSAENYGLAVWNAGLSLLMLVFLNKAAEDL